MNTTDYQNQEALNKALNIYRTYMRSFIVSHLENIPGTNVKDVVIDSVSDWRADAIDSALNAGKDIKSIIDINDFPLLVTRNWENIFKQPLNDDKGFGNQLWLIKECRDQSWAHPDEGAADPEGTRAYLYLIADVLRKINSPDKQRDEVEAIRDELFSDDTAERLVEAEKRLKDLESEQSEAEKRLSDVESKKKVFEEKNAVLSEQVDEKEKQRRKLERQVKNAKAGNEKLKRDLSSAKQCLEESEAAQDDYKKRLDLSNTIAHILEHERYLSNANEATIQQYVVLPILRALGWDDANLTLMEVLPEYKVESRRADYALHIKRDQSPVVLIECKRWGQPIGKNEEQICFYAYSGNIPLAIITNGKLWRFYLSRWEASSLSDRIFCETDIENRKDAISNLEKYLLKSNVASGEAEVDAEIALEEKQETAYSKLVPIRPKTSPANDIIDPKPIEPEANVAGEWTIDRIKNSLSEEVRKYHEANFSEDRCNIFYRRVAETQNLIEILGWRLNPPKLNKENCAFFLMDKSVTRIRRAFGILLHTYLPHGEPVDRNGKRISDLSIRSNPPRIFVAVTEEEAKHLEREHGCDFFAVDGYLTFYNIPENVSELLPILEFAYKKHSGN